MKRQILLVKKDRDFYCDCGHSVELESDSLATVQTVDMSDEDLRLLRLYYKGADYAFIEIINGDKDQIVETCLKSALKTQKAIEKKKAQQRAADAKRKKVTALRRKELAIRRAKEILKEAGEL